MKIGIYGFGNLGKGAAQAVLQRTDMELWGIFTRRTPELLQGNAPAPVYPAREVENYKEHIDVMLNCGGSATDLPETTPMLARHFNVVDSFDTHASIKSHFQHVNKTALAHEHTVLISAGWDPGLFSLFRAYAGVLFPKSETETFWGPGVSQGHTQAIKSIPGVIDAVQYTVPDQARKAAFMRQGGKASAEENHRRVCYVCAPEEEQARIVKEITQMQHYFKGYHTQVHFVSESQLIKKRSNAHGGCVCAVAKTGDRDRSFKNLAQFRLSMESNPFFTGEVLAAFAGAVYHLSQVRDYGAKTVFDLPLSAFVSAENRARLLQYL